MVFAILQQAGVPYLHENLSLSGGKCRLNISTLQYIVLIKCNKITLFNIKVRKEQPFHKGNCQRLTNRLMYIDNKKNFDCVGGFYINLLVNM